MNMRRNKKAFPIKKATININVLNNIINSCSFDSYSTTVILLALVLVASSIMSNETF